MELFGGWERGEAITRVRAEQGGQTAAPLEVVPPKPWKCANGRAGHQPHKFSPGAPQNLFYGIFVDQLGSLVLDVDLTGVSPRDALLMVASALGYELRPDRVDDLARVLGELRQVSCWGCHRYHHLHHPCAC